MKHLKPGKYKHYKGGEYEVISLARHSETMEVMAIYKPLYPLEEGELKTWVRPVEMFYDEIELQGETVLRFTFMGD
jgi:hypothetical protein